MAKKVIVLCICSIFISCTAHQPIGEYGAPGFWLGLWHGIIAPIAFIISLFSDIRIYAFPNGGRWYDFGFILGTMISLGGSSTAAIHK